MDAALKLEGLAELLALIQRLRLEEAGMGRPQTSFGVGRGAGFRAATPEMLRRRMPAAMEPVERSVEGEAAVARFRSLPWESLTALMPGKRFGTKLLVLTAWLEAQAGQPVFKGDVRAHFARTGEPFPANPGRDTRSLIIDGLILKSSDRQHLSLSEAGWKEAMRWLDSEDDDASGAVASLI